MQRAKFGDEGEGGGPGGAAALLLQVQCNFLFPSSFVRSLLPCFLPSLSSQSSLEIGTGLPPSPSFSSSSCCTGTIIALRTVRARCGGGGFCCMHLQFSLSTPLPRSRNCRTNERPTFKEEDRNRSIGNLSKVYLPQAVHKGHFNGLYG